MYHVNYRNEDPVHYFLECPAYQLARTNLLRSVDPIITYIFQDINDLVNRMLNSNNAKWRPKTRKPTKFENI